MESRRAVRRWETESSHHVAGAAFRVQLPKNTMKTRILPRANLALTLTLCAAPLKSRANDLLAAVFPGDVIARYDGTTGAFLGTFATHPSMDGPTAMVYGADGHLYVLSEFSHNVLRFNGTTGAFIDEFISSATLTALAGVGDPGDMELGPDGNLYISSHFPLGSAPFTAVWKFSGTVANTFLGPFASFGAAHHTHGLSFGPGGKLYLGDIDAGGPQQFDATTGASLGVLPLIPPFSFPFGDLTFTPDGTLYATGDGSTGVIKYDGVTTTSLIPAGPGESYWGILADSGFLYVGNKSTGTVKKYTDTGVFVSDFITGPFAPFAFDLIPMVPEPGTAGLLVAGLAGLGLRRRRK